MGHTAENANQSQALLSLDLILLYGVYVSLPQLFMMVNGTRGPFPIAVDRSNFKIIAGFWSCDQPFPILDVQSKCLSSLFSKSTLSRCIIMSSSDNPAEKKVVTARSGIMFTGVSEYHPYNTQKHDISDSEDVLVDKDSTTFIRYSDEYLLYSSNCYNYILVIYLEFCKVFCNMPIITI